MIRSFDLAMDKTVLRQVLNDPAYRIVKCSIGCSKSGFATANLYYVESPEPINRKRKRSIERFVLFNGRNPHLDERLSNLQTKLIRLYEFITEQGVIIVIDYELKEERT